MPKEFLGKGWAFPIRLNAVGQISLSEYEDDIRESIRIILLTAQGERVMRPDFGSGLHEYVFERMSATVIGTIQATVQNALIKWEPRIQVLGVSVTPAPHEDGTLLIDVDYRVRATNTRFNLVFPFYIEQ